MKNRVQGLFVLAVVALAATFTATSKDEVQPLDNEGKQALQPREDEVGTRSCKLRVYDIFEGELLYRRTENATVTEKIDSCDLMAPYFNLSFSHNDTEYLASTGAERAYLKRMTVERYRDGNDNLQYVVRNDARAEEFRVDCNQ
ncbi:MAG: hypothetical protein K0S95_741 [Pantoea eucrina]|jgi:hypothetical protein|nr:hypothetical protein [Pantoea eucrina]